MSSTKFLVLPTEPADAEGVGIVRNRAFGPGSFNDWVFPKSKAHLTPPEELARWRADRLREMLKAEDFLHFKCVPEDDHSKLVGYAAWYKPGHFKPGLSLAQSEGLGDKKEGDEKKEKKYPAAMDVEAQQYAMATIDRERQKIWGEESNYWCMSPLHSHTIYLQHAVHG